MNRVIEEIIANADLTRAEHAKRFFKTQKGEYAEGDLFYGVCTPIIRKIVKSYVNTSYENLERLIKNPYHEVRLCALLILVEKFKKSISDREKIVEIYLNNVGYINNWDLVDLTAYHIIGAYEYEQKSDKIIKKLSISGHLWSERIAIVSTYYLIKHGDFALIFHLAKKFLTHKHDLIHKSTGWMLREVGKKNQQALCEFLDIYYQKMPRTMLRYSIERLAPELKKHYMSR